MSFRQMADGIGGAFRDPQAIRDRFGPAIVVGGYIDGQFAWTSAQWDLFDASRRVHITVNPNDLLGDVIDCENGDADPVQAAAWVHARRRAGYARPTIYCNASAIGAVRAATGTLVLGRDFDIWAASWSGEPHRVDAGGGDVCAVTQYAGNFGGFADLDAIYSAGWPHRTDTPDPAPHENWTEQMIDNLLTVSEGHCPPYLAYRVQGLCVGVGKLRGLTHAEGIAVDGKFGPETTAAVTAVQASYGLTRDGKVGKDTWGVLVAS